MAETRKEMRTPITLKVKFKSSSLDQFIERYSVDVSRGGIFIRTKEPLAVGTQLRFEFQLQDSSSLIQGEGTVVWIREYDPQRTGVAPGMGVRFDRLHPESQSVLDQILTEKNRRSSIQMESRFDAGPRRGTPASVATDDSHRTKTDPNPEAHLAAAEMASADDQFPAESTRVMHSSVVQKLADRSRDHEPAEFEGEPTRRVSAEEVSKYAQKSGTSTIETPAPTGAAIGAARDQLRTLKPLDEEEKTTRMTLPPDTRAQAGPAFHSEVDDDRTIQAPPPVMSPPASAPTATAAPRRPRSLQSAIPLAVGTLAFLGACIYFTLRGTMSGPSANSPTLPASNKLDPESAKVANLPSQLPTEPAATAPTPGANPTAPKPQVPELAPAEKPVETEKPAGLFVPVATIPEGATVLVNGVKWAEATPTTLTGLETNKTYQVQFQLKGYKDAKAEIRPKPGAAVSVPLQLKEKRIEIASTPGAADVFFDGKRVGKTPFTVRNFKFTDIPHQIELRRTGYVSYSRSIATDDVFTSRDDVEILNLTVALEAQTKTSASRPVAEPKPVAKKPAAKPQATTPAPRPAAEPKPAPAAEPKPAEPPAPEPKADKPAAEKPAEEKKTDDGEKNGIKVPAWMKKKPEGDTAPAGESPTP